MRIDYEPSFVEQTIFYAGRQDPKLEAELHRATDRLYGLTDAAEREAGFQEVYGTFFRRLGYDRVVTGLLAERPVIEARVQHCIVRYAVSAKKEAAELFIRDTGDSAQAETRSLFIHAYHESLLNPEPFERRMRREFLHVADMLDESFGYRKDSLLGNQPRQNLIRDRYRVLWDIYVEGRLSREGHADDKMMLLLSRQFEKVFAKYSTCPFPPSFERVYRADKVTHDQLLEWATSPELLFQEDGATPCGTGPAPGEPCPACKFSTFDWFAAEEHTPALIAAVQAAFPKWQPRQGICRQCADIYAGTGRFSDRQPATDLTVVDS